MKADGDRAESLALEFLLTRGCKLVTRNFRSRFGEIDLIVRDGGTLVFVEVRKRGRSRFGTAADSITTTKQQKLIATAGLYLTRLSPQPPCRFDAVLIDAEDRLEWLKDAFRP